MNKPKKNPTLKIGILGAFIIWMIGANMGQELFWWYRTPNSIFILSIATPIVLSYLYDRKKHHPKYNEFMKKKGLKQKKCKPKKNPTLKIGILGAFIIWYGRLNVIFILCIAIPIIISYLYDRKKHHPKYNEFMEKQRLKEKEHSKYMRHLMKKEKEYLRQLMKEKKEYLRRNNINEKTLKIRILDSGGYVRLDYRNKELYILKNEGNLEFLSTKYNKGNKKVRVSIEDIVSFKRFGDMYSYSNVIGGGGGGTSVTGAIVGGIIAGETGAIIGSRKKVEEIKTENVVIDKRTTILELKYKNNLYYITLESKDYEVLLKLIPNKEIAFVQNK